MSTFKIGATIPVTSYGNLQPEIEVEAESYEDAYSLAMPRIEAIWNRYCEPGRELRSSGRVKLEAFVGGEVYYDAERHEYTNEAGERYVSGSEYAHSFEEPFDAVKMSEALAKKHAAAGVKAEDIRAMWEMKAEISRGLGTALHAAMELYGCYNGLATSLNKTTATHDNPMVMEAVKQFYTVHKDETAAHEVLIVDHAAKRAGRIDRLVETPKGYIIADFKTDVNIFKKLPIYKKQLNFYRAILEAGGLTVTSMHIYHWDGKKWTKHILDKEEIK